MGSLIGGVQTREPTRSSIYKRISEGSFPVPLKLSDHCVRWRREDLEAWIENPQARS